MSRRPLLAACVAAFACVQVLALGAPDRAHAGDYTVVVCKDDHRDHGASFGNGALGGSTNGPASVQDWCDGYWGLTTYLDGGLTYSQQGAALNACAPAGTRFVYFDLHRQRHWRGTGYSNQIDGGPCGGYELFEGGGLPDSFDTLQDWHWVGRGIDSGGLRLLFECAAWPCNGEWGVARYRNIQIVVRDHWGGPAIHDHGGTLWSSSGWLRGTHTAWFDTEDNVGVKRTRITAGDQTPLDAAQTCDYASLTPCRTGRFAVSASLDTGRLANGSHTLTYSSTDSGNAESKSQKTIHVDNAAPSAALDRTAGGYSRTVTWQVTDAHSGVDGATLVGSYSTDDGATWQSMNGGSWNAPARTYSADVPATVAGDTVKVRVAGRDNAQPGGNAFTSADASITVDSAAPQPPTIATPGRWLNASDPPYYDVELTTPGPHPASGVAGYSVTRDDSAPDTTIDRSGTTATYRLDDLPNGTTTVRARALSGAGAASDAAEAAVRMDREPPTATLLGAGSPAAPHPGPIVVTLRGRDSISEMVPAPVAEPATGGAHVAHKLDDGAWIRARGDESRIAITGDGEHTLVYHVVDAAGNRSAEQTRTIVIRPAAESVNDHAGFWYRTINTLSTFTAAKRFGDPCPAGAVLTANRDAVLASSDPGSAYGGIGGLHIAPGSYDRRDTVVAFPLPAAPDCRVESATLRLYAVGFGQGNAAAGRPIEVKRATSAWNEPTVNWNSRPGAIGAASTATVPSAAGWIEWDVTAQVRALYDFGDNGLYLRDSGAPRTDGAAVTSLCSREATAPVCASATGGGRPQLVVRLSE